ncbi:MAG: YraN family protein [Endomicrobium sp.]|jgi:putative endonuclease|nr:YraN family protein [Endomicrobium sp.]
MKTARDIGFEKEKEVAAYLKKLKYKILDTNFRTRFGEIDIIAKQDGTIVFIEVKYRKSSFSGTPQELVTHSKQKKIIKSAIVYIKLHDIKDNVRFDVIAVNDNNIEIINSAFSIPESLYYF